MKKSGKSTIKKIIKIFEETLNTIDKGQKSALTLLHLTKTFDCVNHVILLGKFQECGIGEESFHLLKSYLEYRQQMVTMNDYEKPAMELITVGVPQVSIFSRIFINDLPGNILCEDIVLFADDTTNLNFIKILTQIIKLMNSANSWID